MNTQQISSDQCRKVSLGNLVSLDMKERFSALSKDNPNICMFTVFEQKTKMSRKTLSNWLKNSNAPYTQSIETFYFDFLDLSLSEIPLCVKDYFNLKGHKTRENIEVEDLSEFFRDRPIHQVIYRLVKCNISVSQKDVADEYGKNGLRALNDLESKGIINLSSNIIKRGKVQALPSGELYLEYAKSHAHSFDWGGLSHQIDSSSSAFIDHFYEINSDYASDLYKEIEEATKEIFNKYEASTAQDEKGRVIDKSVFQGTTLITKLAFQAKGDVLQ